jgi:hypothetical protein
MALPTRDQTFALENCRDLLRKLEREIERSSAPACSVEDRIDHAFNAVVTAWHLCDWVFGDMTPEQRDRLQIHSLADLQGIARKCRALHLCAHAANASKHWKVTQYPDPSVAVIVTAAAIPNAAYASPPLYIEPSWYLYFIDGTRIERPRMC